VAGEIVPPQRSAPKFYVIVNNVAKKANVGTMVRSAAAFGATAMLIVGRKKSTTFFGSFGSNKHLKIMYFDKLEDACAFARSKGCVVWGVEIDSEAVSVVSRPFRGSAAFLMGNEGHGLNAQERRAVDRLVYIPHHGNGTASLNVTVASSIIFHQYATWARYPEREFEGQKMVVDPVVYKSGADLDAGDLRVRAKRRAEREAAAQEVDSMAAASMAALLGSSGASDY
jgi:tRNA C32,U32 (ribose-2'-O)-methylase TrmJ